MQLLSQLHVFNCSEVRMIRLSSQLDPKYHVASSCTPDVVLVLEQFGGGLQIEKGLVAKLRLTTCLAYEQNLGQVIEVQEQLVSLFVDWLVSF